MPRKDKIYKVTPHQEFVSSDTYPNTTSKRLLIASFIAGIIGTQLEAVSYVEAAPGILGNDPVFQRDYSYSSFQDEGLFGEYALSSTALIPWYLGVLTFIIGGYLLRSEHKYAKRVLLAAPILILISLFQIYRAVNRLDAALGFEGSLDVVEYKLGTGPILGLIGAVLGFIAVAKIKPYDYVEPQKMPQGAYPPQNFSLQNVTQSPPVHQVASESNQTVNDSKFCTNCGAKSETGMAFCQNCGSKMS